MAHDIAIKVTHLSKCYSLYPNPQARLKQFLWRGKRQFFREFWALQDISFEIPRGQVLGVVGRNGSGKSTLLQLICGTLTPTNGEVVVQGRIAALLELGAGFNPEFTGRENVFMSAAIMGLSKKEIDARYEEIVEFSGIRDFIDQPVKTYSSGMYVRLAFSVATSVDPDILVIDEALSVGDGIFARKSFDRIMALKAKGTTILFCSHSIYQLEALCQRALWLDSGRLRMLDEASMVCQSYNQFLDQTDVDTDVKPATPSPFAINTANLNGVHSALNGAAKLDKVVITVDGQSIVPIRLTSMLSTLELQIAFRSNLDLPCPSVAIVITDATGRNITSCSSFYDKINFVRDAHGKTLVRLTFPNIQLLRGQFIIHTLLMCEQAIHIYDTAFTEFEVTQPGLEVGIISLQRLWGDDETASMVSKEVDSF